MADAPDDFAALAGSMSVKEARLKWRARAETIKAWANLVDENLHARMMANSAFARRRGGQRGAQIVRAIRHSLAPVQNAGQLQDAVRFLQRFGPCYGLRVLRQPTEDYWFQGKRWTPAELIAEARRRGATWLDESLRV